MRRQVERRLSPGFLSHNWESHSSWISKDHKLKLIQENANRLHVADKKFLTEKLDAQKVLKHLGPDALQNLVMCLFRDWFDPRKPDIKYNKERQILYLYKLSNSPSR